MTVDVVERWDGQLAFTVDAALLRELGERLVGRRHIALAEMIKNSYDADATTVQLTINDSEIVVVDNGVGMTLDEFRDFWMRIGSPHKEREPFTRRYHRSVTGSKGVGRLSAQFLGKTIEIRSVSQKNSDEEFVAYVDWREAVTAHDLTTATASFRRQRAETVFPRQSLSGTRVVIRELNQHWSVTDVEDLAREIWTLQPPFRPMLDQPSDKRNAFVVEFSGATKDITDAFVVQTRAFLELWSARLVGRLVNVHSPSAAAEIVLSLTFADGDSLEWQYEIEHCNLHECTFEIRVYDLRGRQRHGVKVSDARLYLNQFGGVHVYDAGFHLPYYGPDNDWLSIEFDHAHRLTRSQLLPDELQTQRGLNQLPTNSRLFGIVHVNTGAERDAARRAQVDSEIDYLKIQVSRDRLVENEAYDSLRRIVRFAVDFYAVSQARRKMTQDSTAQQVEPTSEKIERAEDVLEAHRAAIPPQVYSEMKVRLRAAIDASTSEAERTLETVSLLGPLATAGITAIAYEHESGKQFAILDATIRRLRDIVAGTNVDTRRFDAVINELEEWLRRARAVRALFAPVMDPESREERQRYRAKALIETVLTQMKPLVRGVDADMSDMDSELRLPSGTYAEWSALFQNVVLNAVNAMIDSPVRKLRISNQETGERESVRIEDTGSGVDLGTADALFKPFVRRTELSYERRRLGLGGTGLGLTIVRMLANALSCRVGFVKPSPGLSTAFEVMWRMR